MTGDLQVLRVRADQLQEGDRLGLGGTVVVHREPYSDWWTKIEGTIDLAQELPDGSLSDEMTETWENVEIRLPNHAMLIVMRRE